MGHLTELFTLTLPLWEIFLRGSVVYLSLVLLFRFVVRRGTGAVGTADLLVLVLIANASQNAMAGEYRSIADGLVLILTLIGWNLALDWMTFHIPWLRKLLEADKLLLISNGKIQRRNLRREFITEKELQAKLRGHGLENIVDVKQAYLESDGEITVIARKGPDAQARPEGANSVREKV
jgi:uncharacterized membrane protein YcaP (DUF421 family)